MLKKVFILSVFFAAFLLQAKPYPVIIDGKTGYIDEKGEVVIEANYDIPTEEINIRSNGKRFTYLRFPEYAKFSEGRATVRTDDYWFVFHLETIYNVIDDKGDTVFAERKGKVSSFSNGFAGFIEPVFGMSVKIEKKYGYIDRSGNIVIKPDYDFAGKFMNGHAIVLQNDTFKLINKDRKVILEGFKNAGHVSEGLIPVQFDSLYAFYDLEGEAVFESSFDHAWSFSDGLARVMNDGKYFFVDVNGKNISEKKYDFAGDFSGGLARIRSGSKYGFIGKDGNYAKSPSYTSAKDFSSGLAAVKRDGGWFYIDSSGRRVINKTFDHAGKFDDELALVVENSNMQYINKKGEKVSDIIIDTTNFLYWHLDWLD